MDHAMSHSPFAQVGGGAILDETVIVVGAGIVGASVAYHAARAGAVVTLVDAGRPGAGVTAASFAWIGASGVRRSGHRRRTAGQGLWAVRRT
jgi:glycine/D-amino acid oxidase-like deaminating enzyme